MENARHIRGSELTKFAPCPVCPGRLAVQVGGPREADRGEGRARAETGDGFFQGEGGTERDEGTYTCVACVPLEAHAVNSRSDLCASITPHNTVPLRLRFG